MNADRLLVIGIVAALVLMVGLAIPAATEDDSTAGRPRVVDMDELKRRIIRGELSDREAMYYRRGR
jgi:hypothetical protein